MVEDHTILPILSYICEKNTYEISAVLELVLQFGLNRVSYSL